MATPSVPTVIRASIADVIASLRAAFIAKGVIVSADGKTSDQFIVVADDRKQIEHAFPDADIVLRIGRARFMGGDGGGRWTSRKVRLCTLYVRTALAYDKGLSDEQWLEGQDAYEDRVLDAILELPLFDADGNALTTECLHPDSTSDPVKSEDDVWGSGLVSFEISYQPNIDPAFNG